MKKVYLFAALCTALAVSTNVCAEWQFDCSKGNSKYGYMYDLYCSGCPEGTIKTADGKCESCPKGKIFDKKTKKCVFCIDDKIGNNKDSGCSNEKPICDTPKNDGSGVAGSQCVANKCAKNEYRVGTKCTACPSLGTCDGENVKCPYGYTKDGKGYVTCNKLPKCKANQYRVNTTCKNCLANATCDGVNMKCKTGFELENGQCVLTQCKKNEYIMGNKCVPCPAGATCDGKNPNCPYGYTKDKNGYVICNKTPVCKANQYRVGTTCTACPANATCDGKKAACKKGFVASVKNGKVTCSAPKKCEQGSHFGVDTIKKQYKNCGNCRMENIKAGKCAKNKKAHKHYYCMCDCK